MCHFQAKWSWHCTTPQTVSVASKQVTAVLGAASVKVNPAYGTWTSSGLTPPTLTGQ